jgi:hypothetical protein
LWDGSYVELISECKKSGAWFATAGQTVEWFRQRRETGFEDGGRSVKIRAAKCGGKNLPGLRVRVHASGGKFSEQELRDGMEVSLAN